MCRLVTWFVGGPGQSCLASFVAVLGLIIRKLLLLLSLPFSLFSLLYIFLFCSQYYDYLHLYLTLSLLYYYFDYHHYFLQVFTVLLPRFTSFLLTGGLLLLLLLLMVVAVVAWSSRIVSGVNLPVSPRPLFPC